MTKAAEKQRIARVKALTEHLKTATGSPDAASLSRSYGVPETEVRRIIGSLSK